MKERNKMKERKNEGRKGERKIGVRKRNREGEKKERKQEKGMNKYMNIQEAGIYSLYPSLALNLNILGY